MFFMCGAEWRVKGNDGDGGLQGKLKGGNKFLSVAAAPGWKAGCCWVVTQAVTQAWEWREFPVPVKSAALCLALISLGTTVLS